MNGAEKLEKPYPTRLELRPDAFGHYSLTVLDGGRLTIRTIPKHVAIVPDGCDLPVSRLIERQSYPLRENCTLQFQVSSEVPPKGLVIRAMPEPADGTLPNPIEFVLLAPPPTMVNRVLSALSSGYAPVALLLLAGAGLGIFLWRRGHRENEDDGFPGISDGRSQRPGIRGESFQTSAAAAPMQYASRNDLDILDKSIHTLATNFKNNLASAQGRLRSELGSDLSAVVERCRAAAEDAIERVYTSALRAAEEATNENEKIRGRLDVLETELTALQKESHKGLSNLLQALPREALTGLATSHETVPDLAQKLEQAVTRYLKEEQPNAQSLAEYAQRVGTLRAAIQQFRGIAAEPAADQAAVRLDPLDRELEVIERELAGFARQGTEKRFRLLFAVDFSAHEAARQTLTEGIAAGLQREIVKLDSFDDYYTKRIGMLAAQVAAECADLADSVLDPQRTSSVIQSALQSVFSAAGLEEIAPRRNDPFLGTDHTMFQMIRRSSAVDRSGAVAQTVSRGLRQRDRVVRKATVILFE